MPVLLRSATITADPTIFGVMLPLPEISAAGLEALFRRWLERCQVPLAPAGAAAKSGGVELSIEITAGSALQGTLTVRRPGKRTQTISREAPSEEGHHLLYLLLEAAAQACEREVPAPLTRSFEDLRSRSFAALVWFIASFTPDNSDPQRAQVRALELDFFLAAARAAVALELLSGHRPATVFKLLEGIPILDGDAARELGLALWSEAAHLPEAEQEAFIRRAIELLGAAIHADADDGLAHAALAAILARHGGEEEALPLAARATNLAPNDYRSWAALGDAHRAQGEHDQAVFYYQMALRLQPTAAAVLKDAAASLLLGNHPERAIPLIEQAIAAHPEDPENHANLALARRALGEAHAALAAARRAADLGQADPRLRPRLKAMLAEMERQPGLAGPS
ncbi:MAG: tetratricopeptide repeat protein [Terriglobales bacterium]